MKKIAPLFILFILNSCSKSNDNSVNVNPPAPTKDTICDWLITPLDIRSGFRVINVKNIDGTEILDSFKKSENPFNNNITLGYGIDYSRWVMSNSDPNRRLDNYSHFPKVKRADYFGSAYDYGYRIDKTNDNGQNYIRFVTVDAPRTSDDIVFKVKNFYCKTNNYGTYVSNYNRWIYSTIDYLEIISPIKPKDVFVSNSDTNTKYLIYTLMAI